MKIKFLCFFFAMSTAMRNLHSGFLSGSGVAMSSTKLDSSASRSSRISASFDQGQVGVKGTTADIAMVEESKKRIRKLFDNVEISVSAYDTAWVAMVPSTNSQQAPRFPQCLNWLLDNQHSDGSWGLHHHQPFLMKDALSSTLACILALKKWGIGERQINNGLEFLESNHASVNDGRQHAPIGFDIVFPGMIEYARDLNLILPLDSSEVDAIIQRRDSVLTSESLPKGREGYMAYVSEGMGILKDWQSVLKHQRKNGSLFNSPATTAAALTQVENAGLHQYLHSLLQKFENSVPTIYPFDTYARLFMVDTLESLGIDRHFKKEIRTILDETYRCWMEKEEDICLDLSTPALAMRLLQVNGYDVATDGSVFFGSLEAYPKDTAELLELFKAAEINAYPDEPVLEKKLASWTQFVKMELMARLTAEDGFNGYLKQEIHETLNFPFYANLDRLAHRRKIEHFSVDSTRVLKTSYRSGNISNADFLNLAVHDFNFCQSIHQEELQMLDRWIAEKRLQKLKFARQKLAYCYFSAAATLFPPELSDARISWAKGGVLTTVIDDFFDVGASQEEMENLIQLVERPENWTDMVGPGRAENFCFSILNCREDLNDASECCSEHVEIIFSALRSTILETHEKALVYQGRDVMSHLKAIWLDLLKSMMKEAEWSRNKTVPTLDEYMENGYVSFALGPIVLPALYLVGPKLSSEIVESPEFNKLYRLMSTIGRLLNDIHSFKRESEEGKLNAVSLRMSLSSGGGEEDAVESMKRSVSSLRKDLMRLVYEVKGSLVPRDCKELFWKMSKVLHLFYMKEDGFTSQNLHGAVNSVLHEAVSIR